MDKKYLYTGLGILVLALLIFTIPKYFTGNVINNTQINSDIEKIEVIHFHSTNQCYPCRTLGELTEETINVYFQDELKRGKITFAHINVDLPENKELVEKYGAIGSSLLIGTYYMDGSFLREQNNNVWYKIGDKTDFMNYFKEVIESKLSGE